MSYAMKTRRGSRGFSLVETMVAVGIFGMVTFAIFEGLVGIERTMEFESSKDRAEGGTTRFFAQLGQDVRESSYAYIHAGDWYAIRDLSGSHIQVARNFLSTYPTSGGTTLVPGISNEGWAQCPNPACTWCNRLAAGGATAFEPHIHLSHVVRNNAQSVSPLYPPPALQFSTQDRKGRLFAKRSPGERCPFCGSTLQSMAYFTGVVMLSPRENDGTFSYTDDGEEPLWESMIFYCPFRYSSGESEIRRYVFFASQWNANASLVDLMDFDDNGLIETPPMTDTNGDFILDADGELFCFVDGGTGSANWLYFLRWDSATSRYFRIYVNRTTGTALVTVNGGTYGDGVTRQFSLLMERYATGVADFDVSHFINNPSYESAGATVNPEGVAELSGVRFTVVADRENTRSEEPVESVQTVMFRPRN